MRTFHCHLLIAALAMTATFGFRASAAETTIEPAKVQQLKRVEPLDAEKLDIFVQAQALTRAQADLLLKHIDANGTLNLPARYLVRKGAKAPAASPTAPPPSRTPVERRQPAVRHVDNGPPTLSKDSSGAFDVLTWVKRDDARPIAALDAGQARDLKARIRNFRFAGEGERIATRRALRAAGPAANPLIAQFYNDPVDLEVKVDLWRAVARRNNPRAAGFIAYTHQQAVKIAHPVLVPYAKDVGGLILRREKGGEEPLRKWYDSRTLRDMILDLENSISRCCGIRSAMYLMDVYAARYNVDKAPMRDDDRDRHRMVRACGGDIEDFDQDEPKTWSCSLAVEERILIAERLHPHLRAPDKDTRKIAGNGLMIVLKISRKIKDFFLDDARKEWKRFLIWYPRQIDELLEGPR